MLGNYKIKVNNEVESKEAQELFFELGYYWTCGLDVTNLDAKFLYVKNNIITMSYYSDNFYDNNLCELTLHQLRDLVVLHRNDVNDWNCVDPEFKEQKLYLCSDKTLYVFDGIVNMWRVSSKNDVNLVLNRLIMRGDKSLNNLISGNPEQGLVTGSDAFNAKMAGESVLWKMEGGDWQEWTDCTCWSKAVLTDVKYSFKIKPKTVKIEIEIPAPFEPKEGEEYFLLNPFQECGYDTYIFDSNGCDHIYVQFGAWRTEEEIQQVVAALRNSIKGIDNV